MQPKRKFTNNYGLPRPLARALANDDYVRHGDWSITELIKPPQIVQLIRRHEGQIVTEVMDNVWSLYGRAMHYAMSLAKVKGSMIEERRNFQIDDQVVSMQPDFVYPLKCKENEDRVRIYGMLDFKNPKAYAVKKGAKPDWTQQINGYNLGWHKQGIRIEKAAIAAFIRDWAKLDAAINQGGNYPQSPIDVIPIELWPVEQTEQFYLERIKAHMEAAMLSDHELPECSQEERWPKPDCFRVVTGDDPGRAVPGGSFFKTRAEADHFNNERREKNTLKGGGYKKNFADARVVYQHGESKRCAEYCDAAPFCHQYAKICGKTVKRKRPF